MRRYVPKTYYNHRLLRILIRAVAYVLIASLVLFIALFFGLRTYIVPNIDGSQRLEIPWLAEESGEPSPTVPP